MKFCPFILSITWFVTRIYIFMYIYLFYVYFLGDCWPKGLANIGQIPRRWGNKPFRLESVCSVLWLEEDALTIASKPHCTCRTFLIVLEHFLLVYMHICLKYSPLMDTVASKYRLSFFPLPVPFHKTKHTLISLTLSIVYLHLDLLYNSTRFFPCYAFTRVSLCYIFIANIKF